MLGSRDWAFSNGIWGVQAALLESGVKGLGFRGFGVKGLGARGLGAYGV